MTSFLFAKCTFVITTIVFMTSFSLTSPKVGVCRHNAYTKRTMHRWLRTIGLNLL